MKNQQIHNVHFNLIYFFIALVLIIYEISSSIFIYLPVFYGVFFCYMFFLLEQKERTLYELDFRWYFCLFFLFFTDVTHNFFIFSSWIAFFIFYYFFAYWIKTNLKMEKFIPITFVLCAYSFIYIIDLIFSYIAKQDLKFFGIEYFYSLVAESFIAYILFRNKI
ncbi:hypothetical protein [Campylobacter sp. TTU_617]|uniref:hypothetical protein n=1 Tax=Campylobacter sp. TTU_617 TaxID=2768148 RepID=UPI001904BCCA|nr:hypothetical protein [Campylobacter sp. TTU_617]MBK1972176.1 hypothetical protein [Campylobacter sp. TTU_617]